jgi:hypothetical protein
MKEKNMLENCVLTELNLNEIIDIEGGKITFEDACSGLITAAMSGAGVYAGEKGSIIGFGIGGPAGAILGGAVGFIGGVIVSNILIKD